MWSRRRRRSVPPVLLPSLDRLSTLIERVVELIDAVGAAQAPAPEPEPVPESTREPEPVAEPTRELPAVAVDGVGTKVWLAFVPSPHGYRLVERRGAPPVPGAVLELDDARYRTLRLAPSPLPGDGRRCAYLEKEEAPREDRTFDA